MAKINLKKKNILCITFLGILEPVAFSQVFSYIVKLAKEDNFKFTLLTFEKKSFLNRKNYLCYDEIAERLRENNIDWRMLRHHAGIGKIYDLVLGFLYIFFLVLKKKINIIHARSNEPIILAFFISKIFKVKVIYDRRGMMAEDYSDDATTEFKIKRGGLIYKLMNRLERKIMLSSDAIIVLTEKIYRHIIQDEELSAKKNAVYVIPCCVNLNVFSRFLKNSSSLLSDLNLEDKFIINYTGSLCNLHSLSEMLDFFKVTKKVIANAHFMFLTLVDRTILETQIKLSGLSIEDFTIISTSPLKVNEYLSICDASVMFFKPTLIRLAASPTKFAECLASGLPIIINKNIGDTEELIERNKVGVIIENFAEPDYLRALDRLLELLRDPDLRLRCRKTAESNFSLQFGTERYKKIYESLLT